MFGFLFFFTSFTLNFSALSCLEFLFIMSMCFLQRESQTFKISCVIFSYGETVSQRNYWLEYKIGYNLWRNLVVPVTNCNAAHAVRVKNSIPGD